MESAADNISEKALASFRQENRKAGGIRVFVAGGSRPGNDDIYTREAYKLGQKIVEMNFKLDFGLSNSGIMGAVARGVLDKWSEMRSDNDESPVQGITTEKYLSLYSNDDDLIKNMDIIVAKTLEERKQLLLNADFVVFAPGGVGTLDELAFDCVAMQDGMLKMKPFVLYNINGFFYHILEYMKYAANQGFSDNMPFIVVDNEEELEVAFKLLKSEYFRDDDTNLDVYYNSRKLMTELPYYIKQKNIYDASVENVQERIHFIIEKGTDFDREVLDNEIETAYLDREIERLYARLIRAGRDTGSVSDKLTHLKNRLKIITSKTVR